MLLMIVLNCMRFLARQFCSMWRQKDDYSMSMKEAIYKYNTDSVYIILKLSSKFLPPQCLIVDVISYLRELAHADNELLNIANTSNK